MTLVSCISDATSCVQINNSQIHKKFQDYLLYKIYNFNWKGVEFDLMKENIPHLCSSVLEVYLWKEYIRTLNILECGIQSLDKYLFMFARIDSLNINRNNISKIESFTFVGEVKTINLNDNNILFVENKAFAGDKIEDILLVNNKLKIMDENIFAGTRLFSINISKNLLNNVGDFNFLYETGATVGLSYNNISTLESHTFITNQYYILIDLSHNNIEKIPDDIFVNKTISKLNLEYNRLVTLPAPISDRLIYLLLEGNNIDFGNMRELQRHKNIKFSMPENGLLTGLFSQNNGCKKHIKLYLVIMLLNFFRNVINHL